MDVDQIVTALIQERDRLNRAIEALQDTPKKGPAIETATASTAPKKRHVSAAARKRMAAAQKKRWAAVKAKA
jgi:hypothetical protein